MYFNVRATVFIITLFIAAASFVSAPALLLTPLLNGNRTEEARNASSVEPKYFLNMTSYSGYLTVDERYNSNIFFWYFPVPDKVLSETPWIIWLQGGPGASSLAGLFAEMGPFEFQHGSLRKRHYSWCDEYSMVFIDNPVGAGFSFTDSSDGIPNSMEMYSQNLYDAVKQLTRIYPELGKAPLYIAGESYAGRYVPALAMKILEGKSNVDNSINLQGLIMGNPSLDRTNVVDFTKIFYDWGLIDAQGALAAKSLQKEYELALRNGDTESANKLYNTYLNKLKAIASKDELFNVLQDSVGLQNFVVFINSDNVKRSLHVGNIDFTFSNGTVYEKLIPEFLSPVSPKIEELLEHYRIMIYCGQLDLTIPCVMNAEARRKKWQWSRRDEFLNAPRLPWVVESGPVAGYVKSGGGFTEVLVKGAGHLVPIDKPKEARYIVYKFIENQEFDIYISRYRMSYYNRSDVLPKYEEYNDLRTSEILSDSSVLRTGLVTSVVINGMLLLGILGGVLMVMRWRRQNNNVNLPLTDDITYVYTGTKLAVVIV